jgi:hypothetical protein
VAAVDGLLPTLDTELSPLRVLLELLPLLTLAVSEGDGRATESATAEAGIV